MARTRTTKPKEAPAVTALRAAELFGAPDSLFTGRARVTAKALDRGLNEMVQRVCSNTPGIATHRAGTPSPIKITYIGEQAQCRYDWDNRTPLRTTGVINLPVIGAEDNVIARSIADQYTAYTLHELAHMLLTPFRMFQSAIWNLSNTHKVPPEIAKDFINALEDVDIERTMIAAGYAPGAAAMLRGLCAKSVADVPRDKYGSIEAFSFTLAFGLRGYAPGAQALVDALPRELRTVYDMAASMMRALPLRRVGDLNGLDGVTRVADAVLKALCALRDKEPAQPPPPPEPDKGEPAESEPPKGEPAESEPIGITLTEKQISANMAPDVAGDPADGASGLGNDNLRIKQPDAGTPAEALQMQRTATQVLAKAPKVAQALRQLLDASAYDTKEGGRRSGTLRTSALARVATGCETVFERRSYLDGTDAAVTLLIDQSSSMCGEEIIQARNLAAALARLLSQCTGTVFECLGFTSGGATLTSNLEAVRDFARSTDDYDLVRTLTRGACVLNVFKTFKEPLAQCQARLSVADGVGGTPDAQAIIGACDRLLRQPAQRRVFIMLADGQGSSPDVLGRILRRYERAGIICIGVGVSGNEMSEAFQHRVSVPQSGDVAASGLATLLVAIAKTHVYIGGGDD